MQGMRVLDSTGEYVLQFGIRIAACYDTQAASTTVLSMFAPCAAKTVFFGCISMSSTGCMYYITIYINIENHYTITFQEEHHQIGLEDCTTPLSRIRIIHGLDTRCSRRGPSNIQQLQDARNCQKPYKHHRQTTSKHMETHGAWTSVLVHMEIVISHI